MRSFLVSALLSSALLFIGGPAFAGTLAGVTLPDSATVGGKALVLNGMGLREKYMLDIYVGGLYLPTKTTDASKAINDDVPKRIVMHMVRGLSKDQLSETMMESLNAASQPAGRAAAPTLAGWMEDVDSGEQIVLDYVPGTGCTVTVDGRKKGTIPGVDVMQALWGVYLGPKPPTSALKNGLLGT